jgi:hypothetical protein
LSGDELPPKRADDAMPLHDTMVRLVREGFAVTSSRQAWSTRLYQENILGIMPMITRHLEKEKMPGIMPGLSRQSQDFGWIPGYLARALGNPGWLNVTGLAELERGLEEWERGQEKRGAENRMTDPLTPRPRATSRPNSTRPPQKQFPSSHGKG